MRTRKQEIYDKIYYGLERRLFVHYANQNARKRVRGIKFDRAFYREYKQKVYPYWKKYGVRPNIVWAKFYYKFTKTLNPHFLPNDIFATRIIPYFNNVQFMLALADKNLNNMVFPGVKRPTTAFKFVSGTYRLDDFTIITREEALARCQGEGRFFIKPVRNSNSGDDICSFLGTITQDELSSLLSHYDGGDYIVQHGVKQHPTLNLPNASSVNTIRLSTLVFKGKAYVLPSAVLRVGAAGNVVDNMGAGGYQCPIQKDGTLYKEAFTRKDGIDRFDEISRDGFRFEGFEVPSYDKVCEIALDLASHLPHLRYVAWDFAVDEDGEPVLIEFNVHMPGQNQENCGPTFGDMTDEILDEVFGTHFAE